MFGSTYVYIYMYNTILGLDSVLLKPWRRAKTIDMEEEEKTMYTIHHR